MARPSPLAVLRQETAFTQELFQAGDDALGLLQHLSRFLLGEFDPKVVVGVFTPLAGFSVELAIFWFDETGFDQIFVES
jgi:hypothetical protein